MSNETISIHTLWGEYGYFLELYNTSSPRNPAQFLFVPFSIKIAFPSNYIIRILPSCFQELKSREILPCDPLQMYISIFMFAVRQCPFFVLSSEPDVPVEVAENETQTKNSEC